MTFLRNHKDVIAAMDFFVIPTVGFRPLTIWFIIDHGRRRIIHFKVTTNPLEQWVIQRLRESFPYDSAPRYLIDDTDSIFSDKVTEVIEYLGIEPKRTAYRSPTSRLSIAPFGSRCPGSGLAGKTRWSSSNQTL